MEEKHKRPNILLLVRHAAVMPEVVWTAKMKQI